MLHCYMTNVFFFFEMFSPVWNTKKATESCQKILFLFLGAADVSFLTPNIKDPKSFGFYKFWKLRFLYIHFDYIIYVIL